VRAHGGLRARAAPRDHVRAERDLIGVTHDGVIRRYRDRNGNGVFDAAPDEIVDWAGTGGDTVRIATSTATFSTAARKTA
jgi:hypothetical protein